MTKRRPCLIFGLLTALAFAVPPARAADLTISLTPDSTVVAPSGMLTLAALLSDTGTTMVSLDAASGNLFGVNLSGLSLDDTDFLNNLPLTLSPGGSYSQNLFVQVDPSATLGTYQAQYEVIGHTDPANPATSQVSAMNTANFTVGRSAPPVVPEGSSLSLFCAGTLLCLAIHRRRPCAS